MRFIFMDEAGTSAREPVTVVIGLIADADEQVMAAEALALETLGSVPPRHQQGFVFSAKTVLGDRRYQEGWLLNDRLNLVKSMMTVPRRIGMAVCVSAQWRNAVDFGEIPAAEGMRPEQFEHAMAFYRCVALCDRNIRRHAGAREVAAIVAEDIPEMRKHLHKTIRILRDHPFYLPPEGMRRTSKDEIAGHLTQNGEFRVTRVRNSIHFVDKASDPLVQVADACAFGFRRHFAKEKWGAEFVEAIIGSTEPADHFAAPGGGECWWPKGKSALDR